MTGYRDWVTQVALLTTSVFRGNDPDEPVNRCVEWASTQVQVFGLLGVKAVAVPVDVVAGNREAAAQLLNNAPLTDADVERGAWTVGVHHNQTHAGKGWNGHLVVTVRKPGGGRILIDGTADQLARPKRAINVPAVLMMDLPALWTGPVFTDPKRHSGIVRYVPMPPQSASARVWRGTNAWANPNLTQIAEFVASQLTPWVDVAD